MMYPLQIKEKLDSQIIQKNKLVKQGGSNRGFVLRFYFLFISRPENNLV